MINKVVEVLKEKSSFLITTHISPDGDAIGATSALDLAIKSLNKEVTVYLQDIVPREYAFLKGFDNLIHEIPHRHYDAVFAVDCANLERIGEPFSQYKDYDVLVNIDHHKGNFNFGDVNLVDKDICSAGLLVYKVLKAAGIDIDYDMAIAIYTTILVDTGSFHYSNASAEAFRVAAEMIETGVDPWYVAEKIYENQPINRMNLLRLALNQMETFTEKRFASMTVSKKMLKEADADFDITDGFINFPRSIKGIEVALLFKELYPNRYKLSLRSKGTADVSYIASKFGGGGHKNAAGCMINGNINDIKTKVFRTVEDYLRELD